VDPGKFGGRSDIDQVDVPAISEKGVKFNYWDDVHDTVCWFLGKAKDNRVWKRNEFDFLTVCQKNK
jgi:hypothetical protein